MIIENNKKKVIYVTSRLKKIISKEIQRGKYENALTLISTCANILYASNQSKKDKDLEHYLTRIKEKIFYNSLQIPMFRKGEKSILFFDGFGLNSRGLVQIYIKALCKIGHVIYVVAEEKKETIPDVLKILNNSNAEIIFLKKKKNISAIEELYNVFLQRNLVYAFLYTTPVDVVSTIVFEQLEGVVTRYQINLTDHAFWLGSKSFDYCIEFRDYGASVSKFERGISEERLVKLPFYPIIDNTISFQGYPFNYNSRTKIVFSGGALYKTIGGDGQYYEIVDWILKEFPEILFWYAGSGPRFEIDKLIKKYPNRVYLTNERKDLYQILERCTFYLSTYPLCGGLMFQYAASAGKIPITLKFDHVSDDFLLNQNELDIEFQTIEEVKKEIRHILSDDMYRNNKENIIKESVLSEEDFNIALYEILKSGNSGYKFKFNNIDTTKFSDEYLLSLDEKKIGELLVCKNTIKYLLYFPKIYIVSIYEKIRNRVRLKK